MNWKRFLLNLGGVAAGGFAAAVSQVPPGAPVNGKGVTMVVVGAVVANLIGLFQRAPQHD